MFETSSTYTDMIDHKEYMQHMQYMLSRFSMLFTDMYSARPQVSQLNCGRCDDGFGNIINKNSEGRRATQLFLEL